MCPPVKCPPAANQGHWVTLIVGEEEVLRKQMSLGRGESTHDSGEAERSLLEALARAPDPGGRQGRGRLTPARGAC